MEKIFGPREEEALRQIMANRRDVRGNRFSSQKISEKDMKDILEAAFMAPSVGYSQPWHYIVIQSEKTKRELLDVFSRVNDRAKQEFSKDRKQVYSRLKLEGIKEASHLLAVYYKEPVGPVLGQFSMAEAGPFSVVCGVQNMWLMARAKNIGMGWVSIVEPAEVNRCLGVPEGYRLIALLCLGHVENFAVEPELKTLGWESTKQLSDLVSFESF